MSSVGIRLGFDWARSFMIKDIDRNPPPVNCQDGHQKFDTPGVSRNSCRPFVVRATARLPWTRRIQSFSKLLAQMAAPILPAKCGRLSLQYRQGRYKTLVAGLAVGGVRALTSMQSLESSADPFFVMIPVSSDSSACPRSTKASAIPTLRASDK